MVFLAFQCFFKISALQPSPRGASADVCFTAPKSNVAFYTWPRDQNPRFFEQKKTWPKKQQVGLRIPKKTLENLPTYLTKPKKTQQNLRHFLRNGPSTLHEKQLFKPRGESRRWPLRSASKRFGVPDGDGFLKKNGGVTQHPPRGVYWWFFSIWKPSKAPQPEGAGP